jgi:hypothetical protein
MQGAFGRVGRKVGTRRGQGLDGGDEAGGGELSAGAADGSAGPVGEGAEVDGRGVDGPAAVWHWGDRRPVALVSCSQRSRSRVVRVSATVVA